MSQEPQVGIEPTTARQLNRAAITAQSETPREMASVQGRNLGKPAGFGLASGEHPASNLRARFRAVRRATASAPRPFFGPVTPLRPFTVSEGGAA